MANISNVLISRLLVRTTNASEIDISNECFNNGLKSHIIGTLQRLQ